MIKQTLLLVLLSLCLPVITLAAENSAPLAEMDALINSGQYQRAFQLGQEHLEEWEGETDFDFLFAVAAVESGNPSEAVFPLERVIGTATNSLMADRARLELARANFLINNLNASESLFNEVLATNPPANVRANIEGFLSLIATRKSGQRASLRWALSSFLGFDDNINSATSNSLIDTPIIGEIELDPSGQETDDHFNNTLLTMIYSKPFSRNAFMELSLDLNHLNNFSTDQFDIDSFRGEASYNWGSEQHRFSHGLSFNQFHLDQNVFLKATGLNSTWQRAGNNGWYQSLGGAYTLIRYDTDEGAQNDLRDVNQLLLTGNISKLTANFSHSFNLYHADEDAQHANQGGHNGRKFTGLAYNVMYRLSARHTPYIRMSIQEVTHDKEHPVFFTTTRNDSTESIAAGWFWQLTPGLVVSAEAAYTDNESNIPLFDYSRSKYQLGFRYLF